MDNTKESTSQSTSPSREKKRKIQAERELFSESLIKITDAETRGELRGKIEALINRTVDAELDRQSLIAKNQTAIMEKTSLEDKFKRVESPMYYRSAIEMLEIFYIPDTDKRENMFRLQKWEYILKLPDQSVAMLRDAIKGRGHGLTLENFPRLIRDAYKDCNNPIHEYFRQKFGLHASLKIYFQSHNLHFGMGLTKRAVELLVDCITKFESPTKTPPCTNEPTSSISKTQHLCMFFIEDKK